MAERVRMPALLLAALFLTSRAAVCQPLTDAGGPLPWRLPKSSELNASDITGAKDLLELLGVADEDWQDLSQDQPLDADDAALIQRLLHHLPRIGGEKLYAWRRANWRFTEVVTDPAKHQGEVLLVEGRAVKAERIELPPEAAELLDFAGYYRVEVNLDSNVAVLYAREIPEAWLEMPALDEPMQAEAVFLKTVPSDDGAIAIAVADRIAWLPDRHNERHGVTADALLLAQNGFDMGLWDVVRRQQMRGLQEADRQPFYQLLAAVKAMPQSPEPARAIPPVDIAQAIRSPETQSGSFVSVKGTLRRIDRVAVTDAEIQARLGFDHYYTLYVFVPLKNQRIRWTRDPEDANPRLFENEFPITVCTAELPQGLSPSPNLHEHVTATGVFYKVWTYTPGGPGQDLPQPSPLIVASSVGLVPTRSSSDPAMNMVLGAVFVALLAAFGFVVWRMNQGDERFSREVLRKESEVDLRDLEEH